LQRARRAVPLVALLSGLLVAAPALAQAPVGGAKDVRNDVRGQTGRRTVKIARGDQVFQNELVRTGADSLARVVFLDDTTMSVGPASQVKLDKFVFDPDNRGKAVVFNATRGAFRFFSGSSGHDAYRVDTPQASIGVRGTIYDVRVDPAQTLVVLVEGAAHVCVRGGTRCVDLNRAGESVSVRSSGVEALSAPGVQPWTFGAYCGADPSASPWCDRTTKLGLDLKPKHAAPVRHARQKPKATRKRVRTARAPKHRRLPVHEEFYDAPPVVYAPVYPRYVYPPVVIGGPYYGGGYRGGWRGGYHGGWRGPSGGRQRGGGFGRGGGRGR
jgi:hypothetical protein